MTSVMLGWGKVAEPSVDPDPRVNRLPRVERLAMSAARQALGARPLSPRAGLVFATGYGGLGATEAFLQSLLTRGMALGSPTAFHQSVHHSAAGQLSLLLGLRGPVLTVSQRETSGESGLRVGRALLNRTEEVLVVAADEKTSTLEAAFRAFGSAFVPGEGAAAIVLGSGSGALQVTRSISLSHPASARRFAGAGQFGAALAACLAEASGRCFVSLAAPTPRVEEREREILRRAGRNLEELPPMEGGGFNPSAGLARLVAAARHLTSLGGETSCVLHGLALGGAQSLTVLRHVP